MTDQPDVQDGCPAPPAWAVVGGVLAVLTAVAAGLAAYVTSDAHRLHDPDHSLQQLDLLYLDQPAPKLDALDIDPGTPALIVVCEECQPPTVEAQVRVTDDPIIARAYGLQTADGRIGPGYAIVDAAGQVRYRTFDPGLADHASEITVLLEGTR